jgi:hypothetical protein
MPKGCYSKSVALKTGNRCWYCGLLLISRKQRESGEHLLIYPQFKSGLIKKHLRVTHDHIKPRSLGGGNTKNNLVLACNFCNSSRQSKSVTEFRKWVFEGCISSHGMNKMPLKDIARLWIITDKSVIFYGEQLAGIA